MTMRDKGEEKKQVKENERNGDREERTKNGGWNVSIQSNNGQSHTGLQGSKNKSPRPWGILIDIIVLYASFLALGFFLL